MQKNLLPGYIPPRLVEGTDRWYIIFYAPSLSGQPLARYRPTFSLNRIKDVRLRRARGQELVDRISWWLDAGRPAWEFDEHKIPSEVLHPEADDNSLPRENVITAIEVAMRLKANSDRYDTNRTVNSIGTMFIEHLRKRGWDRISIGQLSRRHATSYLDSCLLERKVSSVTYNNNMAVLKSLCSLLVTREYIKKNPFEGIPKRKEDEKLRRNFTKHEAREVMLYLFDNDPWLLLGLLLQYCCFLRPKEVRFCRRSDIDLEAGLVYVEGRIGKTRRERCATIPDEYMQYFKYLLHRDGKIPGYWYLFGSGMQPHHEQPCGKNAMYNHHLKALEELKRVGKLTNLEGLQWYSWKDTGITDALEQLPLVAVQQQAGHTDPKMTLKYQHKKKVNVRMRQMSNHLLDVLRDDEQPRQ